MAQPVIICSWLMGREGEIRIVAYLLCVVMLYMLSPTLSRLSTVTCDCSISVLFSVFADKARVQYKQLSACMLVLWSVI